MGLLFTHVVAFGPKEGEEYHQLELRRHLLSLRSLYPENFVALDKLMEFPKRNPKHAVL
jgi:hypothetical protein